MEEKEKMNSEFAMQLVQSQLETREETMNQLSEELHDNIGQLLNSTKLLIGVAQRSLESPPETLITANDTLGKAIQELRSLSKSLNKEWLEQFRFMDNLEVEINRLNAARVLQLHLNGPSSLPLPSNQQIILFRIVQEVLQNALKHARAKNIFIDIFSHSTSLVIDIRDDGIGCEEGKTKNGMGMINIRHRTGLLGGGVSWQAAAEKGTRVTIQIPLNNSAL